MRHTRAHGRGGIDIRKNGLMPFISSVCPPLPQDLTDAQMMLQLMMQQWRQKRWLVYRLDWVLFPLTVGKGSYTVGPASGTPDVIVEGNFRPANIQSVYLRQEVGSGPNSFPIDFPMRNYQSRQQDDQIRLKSLHSWPAGIYYDPTIGSGTIYVWPLPVQTHFTHYVDYQSLFGGRRPPTRDCASRTQLAVMRSFALSCVNYKTRQD